MTSLERCAAVVLAVVVLALPVACRDGDVTLPAGGVEQASTSAAEEARERRPATRVDIEGTVARMWWNQRELVRSLDLSRDQRAEMDRLLAAYLEPWMEMQRRRKLAPRELLAALQRGDLEAARELAAGLGEAAEYLDGGVAALKVEVLAQLSEAQLETMLEQHRQLLSRRWVVPARVAPEGGNVVTRPGRKAPRDRRSGG